MTIRLPVGIPTGYDVMRPTDNRPFKLGPLQTEWLRRLRSGEIEQATRTLRVGDARCCLGVACDVVGAAWEKETLEGREYYSAVFNPMYNDCRSSEVLPETVRVMLRMRRANGELVAPGNGDRTLNLAILNDNGATFAEIADIVEARAADLFYASA